MATGYSTVTAELMPSPAHGDQDTLTVRMAFQYAQDRAIPEIAAGPVRLWQTTDAAAIRWQYAALRDQTWRTPARDGRGRLWQRQDSGGFVTYTATAVWERVS